MSKYTVIVLCVTFVKDKYGQIREKIYHSRDLETKSIHASHKEAREIINNSYSGMGEYAIFDADFGNTIVGSWVKESNGKYRRYE